MGLDQAPAMSADCPLTAAAMFSGVGGAGPPSSATPFQLVTCRTASSRISRWLTFATDLTSGEGHSCKAPCKD